jgi:hypothetical protein
MMGDKRGYNEGLATPPGAGHRLRALRQGGRESLKLNTGDLQDISPLRLRSITPMNRSNRGSLPAVWCLGWRGGVLPIRGWNATASARGFREEAI